MDIRLGPSSNIGFSNWVEYFLELGLTRFDKEMLSQQCHFIILYFWTTKFYLDRWDCSILEFLWSLGDGLFISDTIYCECKKVYCLRHKHTSYTQGRLGIVFLERVHLKKVINTFKKVYVQKGALRFRGKFENRFISLIH